ncbi:MAG: PhzF family phenazine biosynthesis protein [Terriglobales bacterium]
MDDAGDYGSLTGVVPDATTMSPTEQQQLAHELGYPETIFVQDPGDLRIRTLTPKEEIPFAGQPSVGAAWLLGQLRGTLPQTLKLPCGSISVWGNGDRVWVQAPLSWMPAWTHEMVPSLKTLEALEGPLDPVQDATQLWTWVDEEKGHIRARTFASRFGIHEDESTGSASMQLAATLGREICIDHGAGSRIAAKPGPPGYAAVGGRVVEEERRSLK